MIKGEREKLSWKYKSIDRPVDGEAMDLGIYHSISPFD